MGSGVANCRSAAINHPTEPNDQTLDQSFGGRPLFERRALDEVADNINRIVLFTEYVTKQEEQLGKRLIAVTLYMDSPKND